MSEFSKSTGARAFPVNLLREALEMCAEHTDISAAYVLLVSNDGERYWAEKCAVEAKDLLWGLTAALAEMQQNMVDQ